MGQKRRFRRYGPMSAITPKDSDVPRRSLSAISDQNAVQLNGHRNGSKHCDVETHQQKLMRHQHRQFGICQYVTGRSAEDHLTQPALCAGAFDQEIAALRCRSLQNRFASAAAFKSYRHRISLDPAAFKISY